MQTAHVHIICSLSDVQEQIQTALPRHHNRHLPGPLAIIASNLHLLSQT